MRERNNREIEQLKASSTLKPFKVMEKIQKKALTAIEKQLNRKRQIKDTNVSEAWRCSWIQYGTSQAQQVESST